MRLPQIGWWLVLEVALSLSALPPIEPSREFVLKFRTRLARPLHRPGGQIDGN